LLAASLLIFSNFGAYKATQKRLFAALPDICFNPPETGDANGFGI